MLILYIFVSFNYGSVTLISLNKVYDNTAFSCKCSESIILQEETFNVEVQRGEAGSAGSSTVMSRKSQRNFRMVKAHMIMYINSV